jgi:hypothetical protein
MPRRSTGTPTRYPRLTGVVSARGVVGLDGLTVGGHLGRLGRPRPGLAAISAETKARFQSEHVLSQRRRDACQLTRPVAHVCFRYVVTETQ